jgi:aryl-alcohol dehydrogenase-like predicted oxidoreductase
MEKKITRREMFRYAGLAGMAAWLGPRVAGGEEPPASLELPKVPRRVLGKTKQTVPILLMGGAFKFDPVFDPRLAEGLRFGVNYIDTAANYAGGASEIGVGGFLDKTGKRKDVWITTKAEDWTPAGATKQLDVSLERMKTDHVDMFFLHQINREDVLNPDMAKRADELKKAGKIRFFGFSPN